MTAAPPATAFARFNPAQPGARGMKIAATGLLLVMAVIFVAARAYEQAWPGLGYVKAFAEAAMVGGLADWFAVTANQSARPPTIAASAKALTKPSHG